MENNTEDPQKILKIEPPYDPATPLLGVYLREIKSACLRDIYSFLFTTALFTITNKWKQMSIT
jgi:hypothetical protein